jgi:hypothetical protein
MKPLSERLELIDKAIDELGGNPLWHEDDSVFLKRHINMDSSFITGHSSLEESARLAFICTRQEFEQRVKDRRAMEKYEYMKEYLCSGVKPDLPDDVEIEILIKGQSSWLDAVVGELVWANGLRSTPDIEKFRIVDERWKPEAKNDWYEKGELPPVGEVVEFYKDPYFLQTDKDFCTNGDELEVLAHRKGEASDVAIVWNKRALQARGVVRECLKPLRTEEDELVERALKDINLTDVSDPPNITARDLIKAGWRPPKIKD